MRLLPTLAALAVLSLSACGRSDPAPTASRQPAEPIAQRFTGLGPHHRAVSTTVPEANAWFDQGLAFLYAFNHDEARRAFQRAAQLDGQCAMAWWGVAISNGPHINFPLVTPEQARDARAALARARAAQGRASAVERRLIAALDLRYADPPPEDRRPLDEAYAKAMREVWRDHPRDTDVGALFAEALMDLRPWDLWSAGREPRPETPEVLATLAAVLERDPLHPLANHLQIHAVEAGPHPEHGDAAAERLRHLAPALGHLVHMPSHIDVLRGRWREAELANQRAVAADDAYRARVPHQGLYHAYMAHNRHMQAFACMMRGRSAEAIGVIRVMVAGIPADWLRDNAASADGFAAMPYEVLVRFGRWNEVLVEPEPPAHLPLSRALRHAARGTAFAARRDLRAAELEHAALVAGQDDLAPGATFGNNASADLLVVAERMLAGEIAVRAGRVEEGLAALRAAVAAEDALRYAEPPDWILPVRHALGAVLLDQRRAAEAEAVYREDLARWPENGWSLFGLARSLRAQGRTADAEAVERRFAATWGEADVQLTASCFCQAR